MKMTRYNKNEMLEYLEEMIISDEATKKESEIYQNMKYGIKLTLSEYAYIQKRINKFMNL